VRLARPLPAFALPDPTIVLADPARAPVRAWVLPGSEGGVAEGAAAIRIRAWRAVPVVEIEPDRMRIVTEEGGMRLLVWVPRTSFAPVVAREVAAAGRPDGPPPQVYEAGVFVEPGLRVEERRGASWHVVGLETMKVDAWIPNDAVADWFTPTAAPAAHAGRDRIHAGTSLRLFADDHAPVIAEFPTAQLVDVRHRTGEWAELDATISELRVHGYARLVAITDFDARPFLAYPGGGRGNQPIGATGTLAAGGPTTPPTTFWMPKGTCVFDLRGNTVGVVIWAQPRAIELAPDGAWRDPRYPDLRFQATTPVSPPAFPSLKTC
jgi:hypothetical protein